MTYWPLSHGFSDVPFEAWDQLVFGDWIAAHGFDPDDFILPNPADVGLDGVVIINDGCAAILFAELVEEVTE